MRKLTMVIVTVIMSIVLVGCVETVIEEISQYTVEYVDYDGTVLQTEDYDFEADISGVTAPTNPSREGHTFDTWSGTVPETMGTEKITVTATYTVNQYTVEYVDHDGIVLQTEDYDFGSDITGVSAPTDPTREGYIFDAWIGTVPATMGTEKITLIAEYIENPFLFDENTGTILGFNRVYSSDFVIPNQIGGVDVIIIGDNAFNNCSWRPDYSQIVSLTLPEGLISIGDSAFKCHSINSLTLPNGLEEIGEYAFSETDMVNLVLPSSLITIGEYAFYNNEIISVEIPNGITELKNGVFDTNNITNLTLPDSVLTIGFRAFYNNKITSLELPNDLTYIDDSAFGFNEFTSVDIPSSVEFVGYEAFDEDVELIFE